VAHGPDGVLLVDKPAGITSTRALGMAKRALDSRKAGHTGTLDPFATGLLPLVFGEATKFSRFLIDSDKCYLATLVLGATTATGDTESEVVSHSPVSVTFDEIAACLRDFTGFSQQTPPMHSAVRVAGRRLYDMARAGLTVDRPPRSIRIDDLEIMDFSGEKLVISVKCSKGTYIRTLAEDIGRRLGCGAYLDGLRRTASGRFRVMDAATPEQLVAMGPEAARARLLPVDVLLESLPRLALTERQAWAFRNGQELEVDLTWPTGEVAVCGPGPLLIGVGRVSDGRLSAARLLATREE